jgi:hypothetical protein
MEEDIVLRPGEPPAHAPGEERLIMFRRGYSRTEIADPLTRCSP